MSHLPRSASSPATSKAVLFAWRNPWRRHRPLRPTTSTARVNTVNASPWSRWKWRCWDLEHGALATVAHQYEYDIVGKISMNIISIRGLSIWYGLWMAYQGWVTCPKLVRIIQVKRWYHLQHRYFWNLLKVMYIPTSDIYQPLVMIILSGYDGVS